MEDSQGGLLLEYNSLNATGEETNSSNWQNDFSFATDSISISEISGTDQHDHSPNQKDLEFIQKHASDADPELIRSLLDSQVNNPKRLEAVCEILDIPNASTLIEEFKQDLTKPGDKRSVSDSDDDPSDSKKQKRAVKNGYLQQLRDMFPDADGLFLIKESQQLETDDDFSRFINTVMLSGVYPKKGFEVVEQLSTADIPKIVDIVNKDDYRLSVEYSSDEEIPSWLIESPKKRRLKKGTGQSLQPPVIDVIDLSSDNTEPYDPRDLDSIQEILVDGKTNSSEGMEVEEIPQSWKTTFDDDIDQLLQDKFGKDQPGPKTVSGEATPDGEKSLAEIIEEKRNSRARSSSSPIDLGPSTSKDTRWMINEGSFPGVSTTTQSKPEAVVEIMEEDISDANWVDEQTANLVRIFPNTDPSFLREEIAKMNRSSEAMNEFVVAKLERNDMPTRAEYEKKREMEELQSRYTKNFSIEDFLKAIPDPWKYFSDTNRNCSKYKSHSLCYLKSNFRKHYIKDIIQTLNDNNDNLYMTYKMMKNQEAKWRNNRRSEFECNRGRPVTIDVQFLQEVAFIENEEKIKDYIETEKIARQIKFDEAKRSGSLLECQCCFDSEVLVEDIFYCPKDHAFCKECITKSVEVEMGNGRCQFECLSNCDEKFTLVCLQNVLKPELFSKVIQAIQMEEIRAAGIEDLVQCPFCNYATIMPPEEKVMICLNPECLKESCRSCKELNHVPLRCDEVEKSEEVKMRTYIENKMTEALVRTCYKCGKKFVKEDGCNKMTCTCGAKMCYVCRKPVSGYSHFNAQGGSEYHKCPLYSMNDELHVDLVKRVAEEAKAEIMQANPQTKLMFDPTIIMPERSNQKPIPGVNNGAALDVAMRAIRGENTPEAEHEEMERQARRRRRHEEPRRRAIPDEESDEDYVPEENFDPVPHHHYHHLFHDHRHRNHHNRYHHHHLNPELRAFNILRTVFGNHCHHHH